MYTGKRRLGVAAAVVAAFVLSLAACGGGHTIKPAAGEEPAGSSAPAHSAPGTTSPSGRPSASAADQLAGFFAAAAAVDSRLHHIAALVNSGIGATSMRLPSSAAAEREALDLSALEHAIPPGMPTELQREAMLVYSDLVSRACAFNRLMMPSFVSRSLPVSGVEAREMLRCLGNGAPAAARFDGDVAALRTLAQASPPVAVAARDSHAAAEVAARASLIKIANWGCGSCGGVIFTKLPSVVWHPKTEPGIGRSDGTINGIRFRADYHAGHGWEIEIWAC
jgi:hypothetical protein